MSKRSRMLDELVELEQLREIRDLLKKKEEPKKDDKKPKIEFWKVYVGLIVMYPLVAVSMWGMFKLSTMAMIMLATM